MDIVWTILKVLGGGILVALVAFIAYSLLKEFMFKYVKPNKWILVALLLVFLIAPIPMGVKFEGFTGKFLLPTIDAILILFLADSFGLFAKVNMSEKEKKQLEKEKHDVIKPKAKPNRVKNMNKKN